MHDLILHPDCSPGPIESVRAAIALEPSDGGAQRFHAGFRFEGDVSRVKIPAYGAHRRQDFLWKTSCFEVFIQPDGESFYREFNFSPARNWAIYDFDDFRSNGRDGPDRGIVIETMVEDGGRTLQLDARFETEIMLPARVALNAIVEDLDGNFQYWALAFPPGKAEFHSADCRALTISA